MKEKLENKFNDYGRLVSDLENFSWKELLTTLQVWDSFRHQWGP